MPIAVYKFNDGVSHDLEIQTDETLLEAAIRAGIPVRHQCRSGSCLSCICTTENGGVMMRPKTATSLLPSDISAGQRLACQAFLTKDDTVFFDYASDPKAPQTVKAFVNTAERVSDDVVRLELELADGYWLDFAAGQYVNMSPPSTAESRSYSMSSIPSELPKLEFFVRLLDNGLMSDYLRNRVKSDDIMTLEGPHGRFAIDGEALNPMLFIAGGTGLSPILALIRQARRRKGRKPSMLLSFGCATSTGLFATETLELLEELTPTLTSKISIDDGSSDNYHAGNPISVLLDSDITPDMSAYICGPPGMVASAHQYLTGLGVESEKIFYEQFTPTTQSS